MDDITIICKDCDQTFLFTVRDQTFFADRGFATPVRCKACRQTKKLQQQGGQPAPVEARQSSEPVRGSEKSSPRVEERKKHNPRRRQHQSSDQGEERDYRRDYRIKW